MLKISAINYTFYRGFGVFVTFNESIGLAAINTLANQLPFAGGLVAKGVYLKQRHKLAYTYFLSSTAALFVLFVAVNGIVGVVVITYWAFVNNINVPIFLLLGFLGMAATLVILWFPFDKGILLDKGVLRGKWGKRLAQLMEGWQVLGQNQRLVQKLIVLQLLMVLIFAGRFWVAFHMLSQDVTIAQCILFAAASILTQLVSITPGALGIRELIVAGVASILGFDIGVSIVAVGIDRLVATSVIIVMGSIYTYVLSKNAVNVPEETHSSEANTDYVQEPHKLE